MPLIYKPGLRDVEIARVESEVGFLLPSEYKLFLSRMNGFYLIPPDYSQLPLASADEGFISFDRMFGLIPGEECNDLIAFNSEFVGDLDFLEETIVIGEDGGGNPYVLVGGVNEGVYYWDRTHLHDFSSRRKVDILERNECGNLYYIAKNFQEFYDMILNSLGGSVQLVSEN